MPPGKLLVSPALKPKSRYHANQIHIKKITFIRQINQTLKKQCQVNITKGFSSNAETFETEKFRKFHVPLVVLANSLPLVP